MRLGIACGMFLWMYADDASNQDTGRRIVPPGSTSDRCRMQAEIDELEELVALRKDLMELQAKEEQASGSQGEAADTDPGFGFASE